MTVTEKELDRFLADYFNTKKPGGNILAILSNLEKKNKLCNDISVNISSIANDLEKTKNEYTIRIDKMSSIIEDGEKDLVAYRKVISNQKKEIEEFKKQVEEKLSLYQVQVDTYKASVDNLKMEIRRSEAKCDDLLRENSKHAKEIARIDSLLHKTLKVLSGKIFVKDKFFEEFRDK